MGSAEPSRVSLLRQALARLEEALAQPEDAIVRDASIKRFEFTFEMAWRAIQAHTRRQGLDCQSPRDCVRTAFRLGLVDRDSRWLAMVEDRNRTVHLYDEESARTVFRELGAYGMLFRELLARLEAVEREADHEAGPGAEDDV
jgi:nucleotidyltransferase substrate binding protein (TIGR01987 family)